jgi:hypothetical protein
VVARLLRIVCALLLLTGGVLAFAPAATALAPALAPADVPRGDLTGDGTVDRWQLIFTEPYSCDLRISPADTSGPFAGKTFDLAIVPGGDGRSCPTLTAVGKVRSDGTSQVFIADEDDGDGSSLTTAIRTGDDFVVERAAHSTLYPGGIFPQDTDGDGRDDRVYLIAGENSQSYAVLVDGGGHFGAAVPVADYDVSVRLGVTATTTAYGDPNELSVRVQEEQRYIGDPTGQVLVSDNGGQGKAYDLPEGSDAIVDLAMLPPGRNVLTVRYTGDIYHLPAQASITVTVVPVGSRISLTPPSPALAGVPLSVGVHLRSASANPDALEPTGQVVVTVDGQVAGTGLVVGDGSVAIGRLAAGSHRIVASYAGSQDSGFTPSSVTTTLTVSKGATRTTVRATPVNPAVGQKVSLAIQVVSSTAAAGTPTGLVGLLIDGRPSTAKLVNGKAMVTTSFAKAGAHTVLVGYAGDATRAPSGSAVTVQVHR